MQKKREDGNLAILASIIVPAALMIYRNESMSLFQFRILLGWFLLPVSGEFLLFQKKKSPSLRWVLFSHTSLFILAVIAASLHEKEHIFFGLFAAGVLIILLSNAVMENLVFTARIMRLFTGGIAFWVVVSYFPLSIVLSVIFGAVAFFLCYIFFEIPVKVTPKELPTSGEQTVPPRELVLMSPAAQFFRKRDFARMTGEMNTLITAIDHSPYAEQPTCEEALNYMLHLYSRRAESFEQCISQSDLEEFHHKVNHCRSLLLKMQQAETGWKDLKGDLAFLKEHIKEATSQQIEEILSQFSHFKEEFGNHVPDEDMSAFSRDLTAVSQYVTRYEAIRKEWGNLTREVTRLMRRLEVAQPLECQALNDYLMEKLNRFQRCIPLEKIEEMRQKITYCHSLTRLMEEWKALKASLDTILNATQGSREEIETLERQFLSKAEEFASVVPQDEISWMKVRFRLARLSHEGAG
jgi:Txe/YoeB family toxin of Txe-Axe toxin-antitoxin module